MGPDRSQESQGTANALTKATYLDLIPHINSIQFSKHLLTLPWTGPCWPCRTRGEGLVSLKVPGWRGRHSGTNTPGSRRSWRTCRRRCPRSGALGSRQARTRIPPEPFQVSPYLERPWGVDQVSVLLFSFHLRNQRKISPIEKHSSHMQVSAHSQVDANMQWVCLYLLGYETHLLARKEGSRCMRNARSGPLWGSPGAHSTDGKREDPGSRWPGPRLGGTRVLLTFVLL